MFHHQDWEPVVLTTTAKKKKEAEDVRLPKGPTRAQKLDANTEGGSHKKIPKVLADAIRARRTELKLTQDQLAQRVNVRANVVNDIESQRGVYDSSVVEKIKRVLGITNKSLGIM